MNRIYLKLILGLCAVFCATGCSKSAQTDDIRANVIIRLAVDGTSTRTTGATVADETPESTVSDVRLFLIKTDLSEITELKTGASGNVKKITLDNNLIKVTLPFTFEGEWLLYVIANWPDGLTLDTSSYDAFVGSFNDLSASQLESLWEDNHFLMVNTQNSETEDDTDKAGVDFEFSNQTCDEDHPLEITVHLERIASKVRIATTPYTEYSVLGTTLGGSAAVFGVSKVDVDGVALINCVNSFNFIQQWTAGGSGSGQLISPSSSTSYDMDSGYYNNDLSSIVFDSPLQAHYCLENNSPLYSVLGGPNLDAAVGTKMKGRVTGAVIRAHVKTVSVFTSEADTGNEGNNDDLTLDAEEGDWKTKSASNDAEFRTFYRYKGILFADTAQLFAQNPELGTPTADVATLRSKDVSVYENGYMYFTYWFTTQGTVCVLRNVYYNMTISSISGIGDDVPGGRSYTQDSPLETTGSKLEISLSIADWDEKAEQTYTLE